MQDEINEKAINLAVRVGKATATEIKKAIEKLLADLQSGKYSTQNIKKAFTGEKKTELKHGKQTLKQLSKHNDGLSTVELKSPDLRLLYRHMKMSTAN